MRLHTHTRSASERERRLAFFVGGEKPTNESEAPAITENISEQPDAAEKVDRTITRANDDVRSFNSMLATAKASADVKSFNELLQTEKPQVEAPEPSSPDARQTSSFIFNEATPQANASPTMEKRSAVDETSVGNQDPVPPAPPMPEPMEDPMPPAPPMPEPMEDPMPPAPPMPEPIKDPVAPVEAPAPAESTAPAPAPSASPEPAPTPEGTAERVVAVSPNEEETEEPASPEEGTATAPASPEAPVASVSAEAPSENIDKPKSPPKTFGEQYQQTLDKAFDEFDKATKPADKFKALIAVLLTLKDYVGAALNGTLDQPLKTEETPAANTEKSENAAEEKLEEKESDAEEKTETEMQKEIEEEIDVRKPETPEEREAAKEEIRSETQEKIDENAEEIDEIDTRIDDLQGRQDELTDRLQKAKRERTDERQRGEDSTSEDVAVKSLEKQLQAVEDEIDEQLELKQKLETENKRMQKKLDAINTLDKPKEVQAVKAALKTVNDLLDKNDIDARVILEKDTDGSYNLAVSGLPDEYGASVEAMGFKKVEKDGKTTYVFDIPSGGNVQNKTQKEEE